MALPPGTRLGVYEIAKPIGEGGMGQVYRATDTTLGRQVAIKLLPDAFAADPERIARFEREAQTLASLNHPHIAQIYGLEKSSGVQALVMELVEGEDVSQWIARGPIPLDEALPIATQIAEALEAAHEKGIIHRDLKPANIKVGSDGVVKVLDFGLAKPARPEVTAGLADVTTSPTVLSPAVMTGMGVILGTAAYMAPEQAKGREADKRSDIWAFGCVVYEMLTGRRPFPGEHVIDTLANVLTSDPDWSALPAEIPPAIRTLLQSCLTKDRRRRVADISTALFVLEKGASLAATSGTVSAAPLPRAWWGVAALVGVAGVVALVTSTVMWFATRSDASRVTRTTISAYGATALTLDGVARDVAITPDGSRVIYVGHNSRQLFVRALDALEPVPVFTGAPRGPFVSPDSQWIGFIDGIDVLKKVAVTGGRAETVAVLDGAARGATWAPDGTIIFATGNPKTGLQRVAATGGSATVLTHPDLAQGELDHSWPEMLPGGRAVLFTVTARTGGVDAGQVVVLDLQTGTRTVLVHGGSHAQYVSSGHLVYAAAGTLRAVAFDVTSLKTHGTQMEVVPQVVTTSFGAVDAVVAGDGTLAYVSVAGPAGAGPQRTPVWVDRQGRETPIPVPPRAYLYPRLSLHGNRGAFAANDQEVDIWVWDLSRPTLTRATVDPGLDLYPVWTPDGRRLIFSSDRSGARNLYWQAGDGSDAAEQLTDSPNQQNANSVTADGRLLIFTEFVPKTGEDVMQVALDGTRRVTPLVHSNFTERNGIVSPDGRWLAYEANESGGAFEIYVRPFPDVNSGHWLVSTAGGTRPLWSHDGQELFYAAPTGALMRVGVEHASSWAATAPTPVVKEGYVTVPGGNPGRTYDISPDGQRFLMIKEGNGTDQAAVPPQITLVQHWTEELKRLVPIK